MPAQSSDDSLAFLTLAEVARLIRLRKLSSHEVVSAQLARIDRCNPAINAILSIHAKPALSAARLADRAAARGRWSGALHGVPITLKDNFHVRGFPCTAGSKILQGFFPATDSTVARKLFDAGAIVLGRTNMHEFAYGITSQNPHYGDVRNPWNTSRMSGGSSGGSAAALATGLGYGSAGTDTGGSIRIPASFCGVVGLKPTFGMVSCAGVVPLAQSLDHAGPMARTVRDVATLLHVMTAPDAPGADSTRARAPFDLVYLTRHIRGMRIGWPASYFFDRVDPQILAALKKAAAVFEDLGACIEEVVMPDLDAANEAAQDIALAEAAHFHTSSGWFPRRALDYGADIPSRITSGLRVTAVDYLRALDLRGKINAEFENIFGRVSALIAPATPVVAPPLGAENIRVGRAVESLRAALIRKTRPANFTGLPAISLPCGFTRAGLPIGMQLIAGMMSEPRLLRLAFAFQQATEWHLQHPASL